MCVLRAVCVKEAISACGILLFACVACAEMKGRGG